MKYLKVIVERTGTGYSAYLENYPVYTTGTDVKELTHNIIDAANFYFKEAEKEITASNKNLIFNFSIPSLFQLYPINTRHFANRIGMNYSLLSQYIQGRKKPSERQAERIVEGLQEVGKELSCVHII